MNGIHDMGGMHGFGPIVRERDEPVFHAEWERRTFALALAMMGRRDFNVDEFRRTLERIPPARYLASSYYERWFEALESLLVEKGVVARTEIDVVMAALRAGAAAPRTSAAVPDGGAIDQPSRDGDPALAMEARGGGRSLRYDRDYRPRFKAGDRVTARIMNPEGHTRIPRYVRGHRGVIHRDWGVFIFPDTHAHGQGANPQHCYSVEFDARDLWGAEHPGGERVYVDLWEGYLDPVMDGVATQPPANGSRKQSAKAATSVRPAKPARSRTAAKKAAGRREVDHGNSVKE